MNEVTSEVSEKYTVPPTEAHDIDEDYHRYQAVSRLILDNLVERITGRGQFGERLYDVKPSKKFFAGNVSSQYNYQKALEEDDIFSNIATEVTPFSQSVTIRIPAKGGAKVSIKPSASVYYRRFPTREEQREYTGDFVDFDPMVQEEDGEVDDLEPETSRNRAQEIRPVYQRIKLEEREKSVSIEDLRKAAEEKREISISYRDVLENAIREYESDQRRFRKPSKQSQNEAHDETHRDNAYDIPTYVLEDEDSFEEYLATHFTGSELKPLWDFEILVRPRFLRESEVLSVQITFLNCHGKNDENPKREKWRATFFDVNMTVTSDVSLIPLTAEKLEDEYHYDGVQYAAAENCTVEVIDEYTVKTVVIPIYPQRKYLSRETFSIPFKELAEGDPHGRLNHVAEEMDKALKEYEAMRSEVLEGKSKKARDLFERHLASFENERTRFMNGIGVLERDPLAKRAFRLMNESFANMEGMESWRLFQIVFIVMSIPDIVAQAREDATTIDHQLDKVDVIYFPTGGGKTEAYLGLAAFTAFYDRLRGKRYGTTAITKFPLRLLSLQQMQRISYVFARCEEVRRAQDDINGEEYEPFSVGYLVGEGNTPNKLTKDEGHYTVDYVRKARDDSESQEKWLILPECPFCGERTVKVTGDVSRRRILHVCTNPECEEVQRQGGTEAELPVYISDYEVYRYAPTFVVCTIDKIAVVGMQRRVRTLFGRMKYRCPKGHGFTAENKCLSCGSYRHEMEEVEQVDPPSLLIQDELHLLREEFGSFDSHYLSFLDELFSLYTGGQWRLKVIAATATVKEVENQIRALYWRDGNVFPSPGPKRKQSFYAYEDPHKIGRYIVGAIPHGLSRTYAMVNVLYEYARIIQTYLYNPESVITQLTEGRLHTTDSVELEWPENPIERRNTVLNILEMYRVEIAYCIQKTDNDRLQRSVKSMINTWLEGDGLHPIRSKLMTGETRFDDVRRVLAVLEGETPSLDDENIDMLNATSMISHGVDVDKLNFITFLGIPRSTAEYIQAYSRVGRQIPGIVFLLFNPMHVRDRSHYLRFDQYHEYQDLLVEATPLERWAEFAVECTMPGIFAGFVLQYFDYDLEDEVEERVYLYEGFKDATRRGVINYGRMLNMLKRAYVCSESQRSKDWADHAVVTVYEKKIEELFDHLWNNCLDGKPDDGFYGFISSMLKRDVDDRSPMRSLRDIDEQIDIHVEGSSARVIDDFTRGD